MDMANESPDPNMYALSRFSQLSAITSYQKQWFIFADLSFSNHNLLNVGFHIHHRWGFLPFVLLVVVGKMCDRATVFCLQLHEDVGVLTVFAWKYLVLCLC